MRRQLHLAALIARIGDDALQKREAPSGLAQQRLCAIPVLHTGRMDADGQKDQALILDQQRRKRALDRQAAR